MADPVAIAVDAMGGDRAPEAIVRGALDALAAYDDVALQLVGRPEAIEALIGQLGGARPDRLEVVAAPDVIGMDEHPGKALRSKPGASIAVCARRLAAGEAQALVSAGNTGAVMAGCVLSARLLPGVHRPGIAVAFRTRSGTTVLCDVGANLQMKPDHYVQYAVMATAYSQGVLGVTQPKVALLNIGEEESKGGSEQREARALLEEAGQRGLIEFAGAVEGNHIFEGRADVVVCGGFVGNTILKTAEGAGRAIMEELASLYREERASAAEAGGGAAAAGPEAAVVERVLRRLHEFSDYTTYGGAPLLGIDGCAIIAHGRSDARAIKHAIRAARDFVQHEVNRHIATRLADLTSSRGVA